MTSSLPVVIGMGGINAAGRTSFHQGFRRIVIDKITAEARQETFVGLASLMKLVSYKDGKLLDQQGNEVLASDIEATFGQQILDGTLIRKIEKNHFDPDATHWYQKMHVRPVDKTISFELRAKELPHPLPHAWQVTELENGKVSVEIPEELTISHDAYRDNPIKLQDKCQPALNLVLFIVVVINLAAYKRLFLLLLMLFVQRVSNGMLF